MNEFTAAHNACTQQIINALREFEKSTGQIVEDVVMQRIASTSMQDVAKRFLRTITLELRPTPDEWI